MARGFVYLTAVDVASRRVLTHKVAVTLEAAKEIIEEAFARYGTPEIVNTEWSSQFTADDFTKTYQRVYLMAYDSVGGARTNIAQYFDWYNSERPHPRPERVTPKQFCETGATSVIACAQNDPCARIQLGRTVRPKEMES